MSVTVRQVARSIDLSYPTRRRAIRQRLAAFVEARGGRPARAGETTVERVRAAIDLMDDAGETCWLLLAALSAQLPREQDVVDLTRLTALGGRASAVLRAASRGSGVFGGQSREVEIVRDTVIVDVDHTVRAGFATGIQRVTRQTVTRWSRHHRIDFVAWTADGTALRRLTATELDALLHGTPLPRRRLADDRVAMIPWGATYIAPELTILASTGDRRAALARWSGSRTVAIGFDMVPISSSETTDPGMPAAFASALTGVARFDRVAAISEAAAEEYRGWSQMLAATGLGGPEILAVALGADSAAEAAASTSREPTRRLVLCVGSHEPRKNHTAVLFAAERLWQEGHLFDLVFAGGNAWNSERFVTTSEELRDRGRPVQLRRAVSDRELDHLYRTARFTVFPSLHEGFGLPVLESLSRGTPVVATAYGSVQEVAMGGGALLVDPRNDEELLRAMRSLLMDDELHDKLVREARARVFRTWDDYANDLWDVVSR